MSDETISQQITDLAQRTAEEDNKIYALVGPLSALNTTVKTSIVEAINSLIGQGGGGGAVIDDMNTTTTTVWSSSRTLEVINARIANLAIPMIDDSTAAADKIWSSLKTQQAITSAVNALSAGVSEQLALRPTMVQMNTAIDNAVSDRPTSTQMNTAINNAVSDRPTNTQMAQAISLALVDYPTQTAVTTQIGNAVSDRPTNTQVASQITSALTGYSTTVQMNQAIAEAVAESGAQIEDGAVATDSVWSSERTKNYVDDALATLPAYATIDDAATVGTKVWSSAKTQAAINSAVGNIVVPAIDDTGAVAANKLWSSSKVSAMFAALTKASVGLGNVDNTSDANKPVSTAQATANTAVLNQSKAYTDAAVTGLWDDRGSYDASTNTWPVGANNGSGPGATVAKGDTWTISVAGTLGGTPVAPSQFIRALTDNPGQTAANWVVSVAGTAMIDDAIVDGVVGRAPSQNAVFDALALKQDRSTLQPAVRTTPLSGLDVTTAGAILGVDTVILGFGKAQKQINDIKAAGVTLTDAQTLTNKTLAAPIMQGFIENGEAVTGSAFAPTWAMTDNEYTTNANASIALPAPAAGRSMSIRVTYGATGHTLTFTAATGTIVYANNNTPPVPTSQTGRSDLYVVKCSRDGTKLMVLDSGRNI